jgi:hypothetical protein
LVFLCGPYLDEKDKTDRRTILRKYLGNIAVNIHSNQKEYTITPFAVIVDNLFDSEDLRTKYNVTLIEEIIAACAYKNYVFVDTMSTALELGLFSSSYSQNKTTALLPTDYHLFMPSVGYFVTETISKSNNIKLCQYKNRRQNKFVAGGTRVIQNVIAFRGNRVPITIKRSVANDFMVDIDKYRVRIYLTEDVEDEDNIFFCIKGNDILMRIPPQILLYFVKMYEVQSKIETKLIDYLGEYAICENYDLLSSYYLLKRGEMSLRLISPFKNTIYDVITNMQYFLNTLSAKEFIQKYRLLKYYNLRPDFFGKAVSFYQVMGFTKEELVSYNLRFKTKKKSTRKKSLIINGKKRIIVMYTSSSEGVCLRKLQRGIVDKLGKLIRLQDSSYAYKRNCSALECVKIHLNSRYFYKIDIKNFFNSISKSVIKKIIKCHFCDDKNKAYEQNVVKGKSNYRSKIIDSWTGITEITNMCFVNGRIPLGFVSSPSLSNLFLDFFDQRIEHKYPNYIYTRYSDDILISADNPINISEVSKYIKEELGYMGLQINVKKEMNISLDNMGDHVKYLGLNIVKEGDSNYITIGQRYIRELSKNLENYINGKGILKSSQLIGKLDYLKYISEKNYAEVFKVFQIKTGKTLVIDKKKGIISSQVS